MIAASAKAVEKRPPTPSNGSGLLSWLRAWQQVIIAELLLFLTFRRPF